MVMIRDSGSIVGSETFLFVSNFSLVRIGAELKIASVAVKLSAPIDISFRRNARGGIEEHLLADLTSLMDSVTLSNSGDRWVCDLVSDGNFRVKEIRNYIDDLFLPHQAAQTRWIKYIPIKLLKKHGMDGCDSISIPMATIKLDVDLHGTPTDQTKYHSMIGELMYLTASRPDIAFATFEEQGTIRNEDSRVDVDRGDEANRASQVVITPVALQGELSASKKSTINQDSKFVNGDKTTNDIVKKNLSTIVAEAIRLEREMVKANIVAMVDEAVKKKHEHTRAELSLHVTNDVANHVPTQVDSFLQNYMSNHILHVHPKEAASSSIPDLQRQLNLKMKSCLLFALVFMNYHHEMMFVLRGGRGYAVQKDRRHLSVEDIQPVNHRIDDDEVPSEEVLPELLGLKWSGKEKWTMVYITKEFNALNVMMRSQYDSGEEHQYHLDQMKSCIESQIVWESRKEDLTLQIPHKPTQIVDMIKVLSNQGYEEEYMEEIVVKRADGKSCVIWERVHDYQQGLESYQHKVNLTAPTLTFPSIKEETLLTITSDPVVSLTYENNKKEKRVMDIKEILKFCDATLKRVLKKVKKFNLDVKYKTLKS
ncbi:hypothetical protein Tco_0344864 [Tanacetum coccineum]